jgi:hypothetical protein
MTTVCRTSRRRTQNGCRTEVGWKSDEQSSVAVATMASGDAALQLLATQRCGEAGRTLQLTTRARPIERCSSLLWRGRQWVAARCCGIGQVRCNSRQWPTARCNPGQHCATTFLFFLVFFTRQL